MATAKRGSDRANRSLAWLATCLASITLARLVL
jgi:hypothetical protein